MIGTYDFLFDFFDFVLKHKSTKKKGLTFTQVHLVQHYEPVGKTLFQWHENLNKQWNYHPGKLQVEWKLHSSLWIFQTSVGVKISNTGLAAGFFWRIVRRLSNAVLRELKGCSWGTEWVYALNKSCHLARTVGISSCSHIPEIFDRCTWEIGLWNPIILHLRFSNYMQYLQWILQFFWVKILLPADRKRWKLVSPYELLFVSSSCLLKYERRLQRIWANWPNIQFSLLYFSIIL